MKRSPYPLQWPPHTARTKPADRRHSMFGRAEPGRFARSPPSPYEAAKELIDELRRLKAHNVVITSQLPTRTDRLPYADGRSDDPGIAVWCVYNGNERGAEVGLYVDLVAPVAIGDVIETQTGRRYGVVAVRVQTRGAHEGRQHLRCVVLAADAPPPSSGTLHQIRWYSRGRGRR